jgi:hypothetical protein
MEEKRLSCSTHLKYRASAILMMLVWVGGLSFSAGVLLSVRVHAASSSKSSAAKGSKGPKVVYPEKTKLDFDGASIEGELRNPGEFYFQHRPEEKMDSLVKRRKNFHREMLRDVVLSK